MNTSIKNKIFNGLVWSLIQNWGTRLGTLGVFMLLARILSPSEFGLFAAATTVLAFTSIFVESGLSEAVIQREKITPNQLNSIFLINVILATIISITVWTVSDHIATYMKLPELTWILRISCINLLIASFGFTQNAINRRNFNYKKIALISLTSTGISGLIAVLMALFNLGIWSLVTQTLVSAGITTLMLWINPKWHPSNKFDFNGIRPMLSYGGQRLTANILDFTNTRFIELFLAASFGANALGIYVVGTRLYQALMQILCSAILDIAHNAFSRLSSNRSDLKEGYYSAISISAMIAVPIFIISASVSTELTKVVFGEKWINSAFIAKSILLLGALQCIQYYNGIIFNAIGRPVIGTYLVATKTLITLIVLYTQKSSTFEEMISIYIISQTLLTPASFYMAKKILGISLREIIKRIWPFLLSAAFGFISISEARDEITTHEIPKLLSLLFIGLLVYSTTAFLIGKNSIKSNWKKLKTKLS